MNRDKAMTYAARLLAGAAIGALATSGALAQSIDDTIVVTAQRTEQSLQDVPIAVSAFGDQELKDRQIESFQDIQFNVPNFSFAKSQFTTSSIVLRGVGALAVGSDTEPAVSIHENDIPLSAPRLFETEFYDVERIEVLRGPQGTLFGRNATAGVINVITNKADPSKTGGYIDAEYGDFNSVKVQGAFNLPLSDRLALRLAGTTIQRDGYTTNVFTGQKIDDRNINSLRASVRWLPTDNTTVDFTSSYMREDDHRMRAQKQACEAGPLQPLLGCDPSGPRAFNVPQDLNATFAANFSNEAIALITGSPAAGAAFGVHSLTTPFVSDVAQPTDLRKVAYDTTPKYNAEESLFLVNVKHDWDQLSLKVNAGYGNSKVASRNDFDGGIGPMLTVPPALATLPGIFALYSDGKFPVSQFNTGITTQDNGLTGVISGAIQSRSNRYQAVDLSIGETDYWSTEAVLNSSFDGPINFLIGSNHLQSNGFADYGVATNGLDYFALVVGTLEAQSFAASQASAAALAAGGTATDAANAAAAASAAVAKQGFSLYTPFFYNDADDTFLHSTSLFGELYVKLSPNLKLTGGVRHNWDTKGTRQRGNLLESADPTNPAVLAGVPAVVPLGTPTVRPLLDANELVQCQPLGSFCPNGGVNDMQVVRGDFNATTGRAVLQWTPTENLQIYASWTRGFKPGGFNPRTLFASVPLTYRPEVIKAYEAGIKSRPIRTMQLNLTGFYYDYTDLQVSRIVANTSVNDNINAKIYGIEGEWVWQPVDDLTFNANASYLHTKIGDFSAIDVRNPTAGLNAFGADGVVLLADLTNGSNCVLQLNGGPNIINPAVTLASLSAALAGAAPALAAGFDALTSGPFTICNSLQSLLNKPQIPTGIGSISLNQALGTNFQVIDGIETSAKGNELPGSPRFRISGGVQFNMHFGPNFLVTPRVDAYYQSRMFTNIFNTLQDRVNGYGYINAQVRFHPTDGNWYLRAFVQNLTNNNAITGAFDVGQGAGNFQNIFILEPRRYGVGAGFTF